MQREMKYKQKLTEVRAGDWGALTCHWDFLSGVRAPRCLLPLRAQVHEAYKKARSAEVGWVVLSEAKAAPALPRTRTPAGQEQGCANAAGQRGAEQGPRRAAPEVRGKVPVRDASCVSWATGDPAPHALTSLFVSEKRKVEETMQMVLAENQARCSALQTSVKVLTWCHTHPQQLKSAGHRMPSSALQQHEAQHEAALMAAAQLHGGSMRGGGGGGGPLLPRTGGQISHHHFATHTAPMAPPPPADTAFTHTRSIHAASKQRYDYAPQAGNLGVGIPARAPTPLMRPVSSSGFAPGSTFNRLGSVPAFRTSPAGACPSWPRERLFELRSTSHASSPPQGPPTQRHRGPMMLAECTRLACSK